MMRFFRSKKTIAKKQADSVHKVLAQTPLLIAEKTYNTSHPDYDAHATRYYPGRIFNGDLPSKNMLYQSLLPMTKKEGDRLFIPDPSWKPILEQMLEEVKNTPHSAQVFERKKFIENYVIQLNKQYKAHYVPGWVSLEDALFLYWLVRTLKPKTIVQTGVCNGLSSAFMMLALAKNGAEGRLHVIDLPNIFNPKDAHWTVKNQVYGVMIPEGKSSGWIVPDAYHNRFDVQLGDAKQLLPPLVDRLDSIDMFYHDSDHSYNHMLFEFNEIQRKLTPGGLVVADDISWNASLWDFADARHVPAYNYKGTVGVAFF